MSVVVNHLTKIYGEQKAVDDISFEAKKGEVLGFLGPNGAGKSTTMKIATGFISPTSGTVEVAGFDVRTESIKSRAVIGYLPEHNPLYLDMYVHEYLAFSGRVYQLDKKKLIKRIPEIIDKCGLVIEQNKKVGALSKGYRQRVGLAQALLHDPQVLILDEPTTGLDPNQILEIRKLIKEISKEKTVIFSTHIMQEVQALCDRVVIVNKGKIVADKKIDELNKANRATKRLKVEFSDAVDLEVLKGIKGVSNAIRAEEGHIILEVVPDIDVRSEVFKTASEQKLPLVGLQEMAESLEDVFHELTGGK